MNDGSLANLPRRCMATTARLHGRTAVVMDHS